MISKSPTQSLFVNKYFYSFIFRYSTAEIWFSSKRVDVLIVLKNNVRCKNENDLSEPHFANLNQI